MIENINKLEKILGRFKFKQPIPPDIQDQILPFKRKTTVNVLKHFGEYNIFYGSVLRFYFFTKKIGINLTAWQSEVLLSIISAVLVSSGILIAAGLIYYRVNNAVNFNNEKISFNENMMTVETPAENAQKEQITEEQTIKEQISKEQILKKQITREQITKKQISKEQDTKRTVALNRLGITQIISNKENEELASGITKKLYSNLKNDKSADKVVFRKTDGIDKSVNRVLTGKLTRLGTTYFLSIRIANAETGKILHDKSYTFKETDQINEIIDKAAENISTNNDIW